MSEVILRKEAVEKGLKTYYTGKPCRYGHIDYRQTCSGQCVECKRERTRKWRLKPEDEKYQNSKVAKELPSQEELTKRWTYEPDTGELMWNQRSVNTFPNKRLYNSWRSTWEGKVAGSRHYANGYVELRTEDRALHKAHRIIWKIVTGEEPNLPIDHVNGIPWDNRWCNLRLATNQDNARNSVTFSAAKYKGVTKSHGEWAVQWCVNDENFVKRGFSTPEEAAKYYDKIASEIYGEFARLNFKEESSNE